MALVSAAKGKVGGTVYAAAAGTTLPTDATTALAEAFKSLGYTSEDGITRAISKTTTPVTDHHGTVVGLLESGKSETFQFKCIDATNLEALKLTFGTVTGSTLATGLTVKSTTDNIGERVMVFEEVLTNGALHRMVLPRAAISAIGNLTYKGDTVIAYDLTVMALADNDGVTCYEYMKSGT